MWPLLKVFLFIRTSLTSIACSHFFSLARYGAVLYISFGMTAGVLWIGRNQGDEDDGATEMLITRSVLVQIGSMSWLKWKVWAADFRLCMHSYEFIAIFLLTAKLYFSGWKIWVKYVIFWWSYLTNFPLTKLFHIWLNDLQNQGILKRFK